MTDQQLQLKAVALRRAMLRLIAGSLFCLMAVAATSADVVAVSADQRPRIVVSSDIGGTDPDDDQSMVHLLVYAEFGLGSATVQVVTAAKSTDERPK
jgi:hypothetical protein